MELETFYQHLYQELEQNNAFYPYYKLNKGSFSRQQFRKAYFMQRLAYIDRHIDRRKNSTILDCGCGYGSTCLYLAMNGLATKGTTLEYYSEQIDNRKKYWGQFGNSHLFDYVHENIFDHPPLPESLDYIILQDTLHHIEPMNEALPLFYKGLKKGGKLILVEVNGESFIENFIFFLKRGNHRIIEYYDEVLQKKILMGNENFRSKEKWQKLFQNTGFALDEKSVEYVRFFLPFSFRQDDYMKTIEAEQRIAQRHHLLKRYGFIGLNMVFTK